MTVLFANFYEDPSNVRRVRLINEDGEVIGDIQQGHHRVGDGFVSMTPDTAKPTTRKRTKKEQP